MYNKITINTWAILFQVSPGPAAFSTSEAFHNLKNPVSHNMQEVSFNAKHPKCVQKFNDNPGE